jgi:hypothetical protein
VLLRGDDWKDWKVRLSRDARGRSPLITGERPEMSCGNDVSVRITMCLLQGCAIEHTNDRR